MKVFNRDLIPFKFKRGEEKSKRQGYNTEERSYKTRHYFSVSSNHEKAAPSWGKFLLSWQAGEST